MIEIVDEVIELFTSELKSTIWSSRLWINEVNIILQWVKTWLYKKIALNTK